MGLDDFEIDIDHFVLGHLICFSYTFLLFIEKYNLLYLN